MTERDGPPFAMLDALMAVFGFRRVKTPAQDDDAATDALCPRYDGAKERIWIEDAHKGDAGKRNDHGEA